MTHHPIAAGVYLEDCNILLPWNSSRDDLAKLSPSQVVEAAGSKRVLVWRNHLWLNGMSISLCATMKTNEHFRHLSILPQSGNKADEEFARFSRHLALRLGSATRRMDRPGISAQWWKRDDVEISLKLNRKTDELNFTIGYVGPEPAAAQRASRVDDWFEQRLKRLGLTRPQWYQLKEYLLGMQLGNDEQPPSGLEEHAVVELAIRSRNSGDRSLLDQAAAKLSGSARSSWLMLSKS